MPMKTPGKHGDRAQAGMAENHHWSGKVAAEKMGDNIDQGRLSVFYPPTKS